MLSNVPSQETLLRLAARKSFALTVTVRAPNGSIIPLVDSSARLTVAKPNRDPKSSDVLFSLDPTVFNIEQGIIRFDFQASHLDLPSREYPYEIVFESLGYSSIVVSGTIDLAPSVDFDSVGASFSDPSATGSLKLTLSKNHITVQTQTLALRGEQGLIGAPGKPGDPFANLELTYNPDGTIASLLVDDVLTEYTYSLDGSLDTDTRDGVTRDYIYTAGKLTSIVPREIG